MKLNDPFLQDNKVHERFLMTGKYMSNHYVNRGYHVSQRMRPYQIEFKRTGHSSWGFPGDAVIKESTRQCRLLKRHRFYPQLGRSLVEEIATCSSILVWKVPWTEESDGQESMGSRRIRHEWATEHSGLRGGQ